MGAAIPRTARKLAVVVEGEKIMKNRILALAAMAALPMQPALAQACQVDTRPPFETFLRTALPPLPGNRAFSSYPATAFTAQLNSTSGPRFRFFDQPASPNGQQRHVFRWVNRCHDFTREDVRDLGQSSDEPTGAWLPDRQGIRKCRNHLLRDGTPKGNYPDIRVAGGQGVPAGTYRFLFSSVARADACTMAQVFTNLGNEARGRALIADNGLVPFDLSGAAPARLPAVVTARALTVIAARGGYDPYGARTADGRPVFDAARFRNARAFLDICVTEYAPGIETSIDGIVFDWEVVDERSLAEGAALADRIDRALHATSAGAPLYCEGRRACTPKRAILVTHAWDDFEGADSYLSDGRAQDYVRRSSIMRDGLGAGNAAHVRSRFDLVSVEISRHTRSRTRRDASDRDVLLESEIRASLDEQERVLGVSARNRGQLIASIGFGSIEEPDARFLRQELDRRGYRHVLVANVLQPGDRLDDCGGAFHRNLAAFLRG